MKFKIHNKTYLWVIVFVCQAIFIFPYLMVAGMKESIDPIFWVIFFLEVPVVTAAMRLFNRHVKTTVVVEDGLMRIWRLVLLRQVKTDNIIGLEYKVYYHDEYHSSGTKQEKRVKLIITVRDTYRTRRVVLNDNTPTARSSAIYRYKLPEVMSEEDIKLYQLYRYLSYVTGIE